MTPLLLTLLLGTVEAGFALSARLSVANMALAGVRTASSQGSDLGADYYVLRAVLKGSGSVASGAVNTVIVYRALGPGDQAPAACKIASVAGLCNRYTGSDFARAPSDFGCVGPPGPLIKPDNSWCPSLRKTALTGNNGPPDYIGVHVEAVHQNLTPMFGASLTFRSDSIIRIEPRTFI